MLNSLWVEVGGEDEYKPVVSKNFLLWKMEKKTITTHPLTVLY